MRGARRQSDRMTNHTHTPRELDVASRYALKAFRHPFTYGGTPVSSATLVGG